MIIFCNSPFFCALLLFTTFNYHHKHFFINLVFMRLCRKRTGKNGETQRNKFFAERWEYGILYPRIYLKKEPKKRNNLFTRR